MKIVSILGLGWLGHPLAAILQQSGYVVKGSTTSKEKSTLLRAEGIDACVLRLVPHPEGEAFSGLFDADVLFVNIPPKSRSSSEDFYLEQNRFLKEMALQAGISKVVFASSTSVYPDFGQVYEESFPIALESSGSPGILKAERLWSRDDRFQCSVIRYGGLLGVDRIPGRYFSGRENVVGHTRVNFIHRDDAVGIAAWVIGQERWGEVFNAVAPLHPLRREIYEKNAAELGFASPMSYADPVAGPARIISSEKTLASGYKFFLPNPIDFWYGL